MEMEMLLEGDRRDQRGGGVPCTQKKLNDGAANMKMMVLLNMKAMEIAMVILPLIVNELSATGRQISRELSIVCV
jgi:hypothetical protein